MGACTEWNLQSFIISLPRARNGVFTFEFRLVSHDLERVDPQGSAGGHLDDVHVPGLCVLLGVEIAVAALGRSRAGVNEHGAQVPYGQSDSKNERK